MTPVHLFYTSAGFRTTIYMLDAARGLPDSFYTTARQVHAGPKKSGGHTLVKRICEDVSLPRWKDKVV